MKNQNPITIEIWSDVQCPFCYIGKRQLEVALSKFEKADLVSLQWKSYLLAPQLKTQLDKDIHSYIAEKFNLGPERARAMHDQLKARAASVGLEYNFDNMKVISMGAAHRLIQIAKQRGKGNEMEEALFFANFTQARDLSNLEVLCEVGTNLGLERSDIEASFHDADGAWQSLVNADCAEAQSIGCQGVPYFVINRSQAISGAVGADAMLGVLNSL